MEDAQPLDYTAALDALRALVPRGGRAVHGESIWSKTPTPEAIEPLAGRADEHLTLLALLETAVDHGFAPLAVHEATHPDRAEVEQRAARQRSAYFGGYRGFLGMAYLELIAV